MGKKRLDDAIKKIDFPIEVKYRCFELDPDINKNVNYNIFEKLSHKYGISMEQAKLTCQNMSETAKAEGLEFNFDKMILTNTFDAHRLVMFAKTKNLMHEMTERIMHAFYSEGKHIGDHETLINLADEIGLNRNEVSQLLKRNEMSDIVREDERLASVYGIRSIPYFLINDKYSISGAQSTDVFLEAFLKIKQET